MNFAMRCYRMHTISLKAVGWLVGPSSFQVVVVVFVLLMLMLHFSLVFRLLVLFKRARGAQQCQCTLCSLCGQCLYLYLYM